MRLRTVAIAPALPLLLLTACSSSDDTSTEQTISVTTTTADAGLNSRGAVEVQLGETATVTKNGVTVVEISGTALSTEGCEVNTTKAGEISKQAFTATVQIGPESITQWLWPSDFYYVDGGGKITKNINTSDSEPCDGAGSGAFIDLPPNSSADGAVTLDIPAGTEVIGYYTTQGGQDLRVEWILPEPVTVTEVAPAAEHTPASAPAAVTTTAAVVPTTWSEPETESAPPVGYTGAPNGAPQPLVGKAIDYCMTDPIYQRGTTMFTDGTTGWTQECAGQ